MTAPANPIGIAHTTPVTTGAPAVVPAQTPRPIDAFVQAPTAPTDLSPATTRAVANHAARFAGVPPANSEPLERALALIDEAKIKKDLFHIASDEMGGRDTPSEGLTKTAGYLSDRLKSSGWAPGGAPSSYLYSWPLRLMPVLPERSRMRLEVPHAEGRDLIHGVDYYYSSFARQDIFNRKGDVVFVGDGTDDWLYRTHDIKGKWVACMDNDDVDSAQRRALAKAHGAAGIIVIPKLRNKDDENYRRRLDTRLELARQGRLHDGVHADISEVVLSVKSGWDFLTALAPSGTSPDHVSPGGVQQLAITEMPVINGQLQTVSVDNVVGFIKGSHPEKSKEVIVISAHYDHVGIGWNGAIYNGADDNASGTTAILSLVEAIKALNPERSVMLMWVSGEEKGLLGSQAWVEHPYLPEAEMKVVANINLDMVSRNAANEVHYTPSPHHRRYNNIARAVEQHAAAEGFTTLQNADRYFNRTDSASFAEKGIPVLFLTTGEHDDYHKPTDDPDRSDPAKIARVARLALRVFHTIDRSDKIE